MSEGDGRKQEEGLITEKNRLALAVLEKTSERLKQDGWKWSVPGHGKNLHAEYFFKTPTSIGGEETSSFNQLFAGGSARLILNYSFSYKEVKKKGVIFKKEEVIQHPNKVLVRIEVSTSSIGREDYRLDFVEGLALKFSCTREKLTRFAEGDMLFVPDPLAKSILREATEADLRDFLSVLSQPLSFVEPIRPGTKEWEEWGKE